MCIVTRDDWRSTVLMHAKQLDWLSMLSQLSPTHAAPAWAPGLPSPQCPTCRSASAVCPSRLPRPHPGAAPTPSFARQAYPILGTCLGQNCSSGNERHCLRSSHSPQTKTGHSDLTGASLRTLHVPSGDCLKGFEEHEGVGGAGRRP